MYSVINEIRLNKYLILSFDRPVAEKDYSSLLVDGTRYGIVPSYDFPGIVIESDSTMVGKMVQLV